jgi:hypothetical protein
MIQAQKYNMIKNKKSCKVYPANEDILYNLKLIGHAGHYFLCFNRVHRDLCHHVGLCLGLVHGLRHGHVYHPQNGLCYHLWP